MKKGISFFLISAVAALLISGCSRNTEGSASLSDASSFREGSTTVSIIQPSFNPESSDNDESPDGFPQDSENPDNTKVSCDISVIEDFDTKFFVKELPQDRLRNFIKLYSTAVSNGDRVVFDHPILEKDLDELMYLINYDCPELIHLKGDYYPSCSDSDSNYVTGVGLVYSMDKDEYKTSKQKLGIFLEELRNYVKGMNEYDTEKYVYDLVVKNTIYNEYTDLSGSIYGALILHEARCEGISKSITWCMRKLGIECAGITGPQNWDETALYSEHSWNLIRIDGKYYHLDPTVDNLSYDNNHNDILNYGYFNVDDNAIRDNRSINEVYRRIGVPECTTLEKNYHVLNNLYCTADDGVTEFIDKSLSDHFTENGIEAMSMRFETFDDYKQASGIAEEKTKYFLNDNSDIVFTIDAYYNELTHTIVINAYPQDTDMITDEEDENGTSF